MKPNIEITISDDVATGALRVSWRLVDAEDGRAIIDWNHYMVDIGDTLVLPIRAEVD